MLKDSGGNPTGAAFLTMKICDQQGISSQFLVPKGNKICIPEFLSGTFYVSQTHFNHPWMKDSVSTKTLANGIYLQAIVTRRLNYGSSFPKETTGGKDCLILFEHVCINPTFLLSVLKLILALTEWHPLPFHESTFGLLLIGLANAILITCYIW